MTDDKFREAFLDFLYPSGPELPPDERFFHADIPHMNDSERRRELDRARMRLTWDQKPCPWLLERIDLLREGLEDAN